MSGNIAAVTWIVVVLYVAALGMQLGGVYFVVRDALRSRAHVREFMEKWAKLEGPHNPNNWPHFKEPVLADWITAENAISDRRRWAPVVVLLLGFGLGFAGNILALYVPANPSTVAPVAPSSPNAVTRPAH